MMRNNNYYAYSDMRSYLSDKYEFRLNVVSGKVEYRDKDKKNSEYREIADYEINTITLSMEFQNTGYGTEQVRKLLNSDYVPKYNPFHEYFESLPVWDGTDYIEELAKTIQTTNDEYFYWILKKWLVATVASLVNDTIINHTIIVFVGKQGKGKSSWIRILVPDKLKMYYYEGVINPLNKDDKFQLAENMIINLDELQSLRPSEIEALKALITSTQVKLRRPYARTQESMPRRASFTGSVNNKEFLTDTTGNRRFLCIETLSIDYQHQIPIDMVYAQALHLYRNDFRYWFDEDDIEVVNENNSNYTSISVEEDLLLQYLEPCSKGDATGTFGSATQILKELLLLDNPDPKRMGNVVSRINNPSAIMLGKMLAKHGFEKGKSKGISGYYYKKKLITYEKTDKDKNKETDIQEIGYGYNKK